MDTINADTPSAAPASSFPPNNRSRLSRFTRRVLILLSLTTLFVFAGHIFVHGIQVFFLTFIGILIGVGLAGLADQLVKWTHMARGWALALVVLLIIGVFAGIGWGFGHQLAGQADQLAVKLPTATTQLGDQLSKAPAIKRLFGSEQKAAETVDKAAEKAQTQVKQNATNNTMHYLRQAVSAFGGIVLVFFLSLFFASNPGLYRRGVCHLVPCSKRSRAEEVMDMLGHALRRWWLGTLFAMASAGVMTFVGLWFLKIPLALSLAAIAALGEFVPNFGPIAAAIPAIMVAFIEGPEKALWVILMYIIIQTVQSYLITPMVQHKVVDLPPALQIISQVLMGALFGILGIIVATPLLTVIMVIVKMLYVQKVLHDPLPATPDAA